MSGARTASIAISVLAIAAAGCGSDGDGDSADAAKATTAGATTAATPSPRSDPPVRGPREAAVEPIRDVQEGLAAGSGSSVCHELTTSARDAVEQSGDDGRTPCAAVVEAAVERWRADGIEPVLSDVESVDIDGDRAIVTLRDPDGDVYDVWVAGLGYGLWLLPALNLDDPAGVERME
jgi:hypothetical protein